MTVRPRTVRRLGAFFLIVVLVSAGAILIHDQGARRQEGRLVDQRRLGLEALELGDYPEALGRLGSYLAEFDAGKAETDFEGRLAYALARARIHETGERHLEQAGRLLRDLADDFPDHPKRLEVLHLLMDVTALGGEWHELQRQCDEALDRHPLDLKSLRRRREALEQMGEYGAALRDAQQIIAQAPHDLDEQIRSFRLQARLGETPQSIVARAVDLASRNSRDPRPLLVLAVAYRNAGQTQQARTCLKQALESEAPRDDPAVFVLKLAGLLDVMGEHELAQEACARAVLQLAADDPARDRLRQVLALRRWQAGEFEAALAIVASPDSTEQAQAIELDATRILIQFERGEAAQAEQGLATLARRAISAATPGERRLATAWQEALSAVYGASDRDARGRLEVLQRARSRTMELRPPEELLLTDQPAGILVKWMGDCFAELAEQELAIGHWASAAAMLPAWDEPHLQMAEAAMALGLAREAENAAEAAVLRARGPARERARLLQARIAYQRWLASPSTAGAVRAAALAAAQQRARPLEPGTLPAHVHLLSLSDPRGAQELVRQRLSVGAEADLRLELVQVSRLTGLDLGQELLAGLDHPEAALLRTGDVATDGGTAAALAALEPMDPSAIGAPASDAEIEWELVRLKLLSQMGAAEAAARWQRLGSSHPSNLRVQLAILEQRRLLAQDADFAAQTIDRVARITGPAGRRWRLERARWLLAQRTYDTALDAADLLRGLIRQSGGGPESIDERLLLADAMNLVGNPRVATEHLEKAYSLDPSRGDVGLRLVEIRENAGRWQEAEHLLRRLAAEGVGGAPERLETARMLAEIGDIETAVSLLEQSEAAGWLDDSGRLELARLMFRAGRFAEAKGRYVQIEVHAADAQAVLAGAEFRAYAGEGDRVNEALARLETMGLDDVELHVMRGEFLARIGEPKRARDAFALALARLPRSEEHWFNAAALEIGCGDPAAALEILRRAAEAGVKGPHLDAMGMQARALAKQGSDDPAARLEAMAIEIAQPGVTQEWREFADVLGRAAAVLRGEGSLSTGEMVQLERVARVFAHFEPVHMALGDAFGRLGLPGQQLRLATRLAEALPQDARAQQLAFEASRDAGNFGQADYFARRWRRAESADLLRADAALAEARLLAGDPSAAAQALEPHLERSADNAQLSMLAAEVRAANGEYAQAYSLIQPHLSDGAQWRGVAARCAAQYITDPREARRWLTAVEAALPIEDEIPSLAGPIVVSIVEQRLMLAQAWAHLGERLGDAVAMDRGKGMLEQLTTGPLAQSAEAWEARADLLASADASGDAESAYRRALALDPRRASCASRLASLLLTSSDSAARAEALTWARIAPEQQPGNPLYESTLARSCLVAGAHPQAKDAFERALRIDDDNLDAMFGLARLLMENGDRESAAQWYARLRTMQPTGAPPDALLRSDYEALEAEFGLVSP